MSCSVTRRRSVFLRDNGNETRRASVLLIDKDDNCLSQGTSALLRDKANECLAKGQ